MTHRLTFAFTLLAGLWFDRVRAAEDPKPQKAATVIETRYDGRWWRSAGGEERSGFLEGTADCLTWSVHERGFSATASQAGAAITKYYDRHPSDSLLLVTEIWRRIQVSTHTSEPAPGGETWKNPHWYLNGLWWRQSSEEEQLGFLEGYLSCTREHKELSGQFFSRPPAYYVAKLRQYLDTHPKGDDESIASILNRFSDK